MRRSPSPLPVRFVERRRRSPSPVVREHIRTRIVEREKEREPSPSPSPPPPPPPPVIRGPTLEREVITHYTDIDHGECHPCPFKPFALSLSLSRPGHILITFRYTGVIRVKPPSPPPPAPRPRAQTRERETDIDISLSKNRTEVDVDIRRSASRTRPRSHSHERRSQHYHDDEIVIRTNDMDRLRIDDKRKSSSSHHRRPHSAAPVAPPPHDEEAEYITGKIDSRGRMGESWGGATKDWAIVDVPPGTERVRMDGVGGASTETNWSKYSGVRRTTFVPERERDAGALVPAAAATAREASPTAAAPQRPRDSHTSVTVYDREREIDVDVDIERRRSSKTPALPAPPPAAPPEREMWTEITKDLVCREALQEMGYAYEETKWFFYVMDYLKYVSILSPTPSSPFPLSSYPLILSPSPHLLFSLSRLFSLPPSCAHILSAFSATYALTLPNLSSRPSCGLLTCDWSLVLAGSSPAADRAHDTNTQPPSPLS